MSETTASLAGVSGIDPLSALSVMTAPNRRPSRAIAAVSTGGVGR